ncbi:Vps52p NDAI_0A07030 [Naumovozyma dairenensis CBS 421]|uniref:Vacuolar protein sorting-associated protein 52 n=1 Tax=Naumovozyma dairenensis (strain ATCC 10597 / BCRC 20456 / CBS 421 / NBRC 0211 / NRRL Y-12639) TaxID=1071378 RepID=G0W4W9_NAUDC|nr:hypothetical protein NDAI_0A07030 [Naumovozyma dairenensis CBS 421]CCD22857.1 hypothetical protein NDAI_0A07030 [Naumovozyma dairenensis CBS 421]
MDVLDNILQVGATTKKQLDQGIPEDEQTRATNIGSSDIFETFISECHIPEYQANTNLWNELESLKKKRQTISHTLNDVVPPLRDYMTNFKTQLSDFTRDLSFIREKSSELEHLLEYNATKLSAISPLVNDLIIPTNIIKDILHGKIDESWQENIAFIRDKQQIYAKYNCTSTTGTENDRRTSTLTPPKDFQTMCEILECLKEVILERSKKFIVFNIKSLRSHQPTPSQQIQNKLLKFNDGFQFIVDNNYSLALELRQAYSYTMRWYYKEYFARYIRSLTILQFKQIDSQYSLGNGLANVSIIDLANHTTSANTSLLPTYLSPTYLYGSTAITDAAISDYFQIRKRLSILSKEDNTVMVSQIAENIHTKDTYIETGFKNLNLAIFDNCSVEYNFLKKFFKISENENELNGILEQIFQPTLDLAMEYTINHLLQQSYDIFGVLISIRVANQLQFEAKKYKLPVITSYLNDQLILLWPKFQQLIDSQCENLRKVSITKNLTSKKHNSNLLAKPHELTVQFGKFLSSLLLLAKRTTYKSENASVNYNDSNSTATDMNTSNDNNDNDDDDDADDDDDDMITDERSEPLYNSIIRIRNDFETVMTKCSKSTQSPERFLSLNYLYLYNILLKQRLETQHDEDDINEKNEQVESIDTESERMPDFVPLILKETEKHFKALVEAYSKIT